jgi:hypothetical protein
MVAPHAPARAQPTLLSQTIAEATDPGLGIATIPVVLRGILRYWILGPTVRFLVARLTVREVVLTLQCSRQADRVQGGKTRPSYSRTMHHFWRGKKNQNTGGHNKRPGKCAVENRCSPNKERPEDLCTNDVSLLLEDSSYLFILHVRATQKIIGMLSAHILRARRSRRTGRTST